MRSWPKSMVLDGGLATSLEAAGHDLSGRLWSGQMLLDETSAIGAVHLAHALAGAQVVTTASYQVSRRGFTEVGRSAAAADAALTRAVEVARQAAAAAEFETGRPVAVAASVGPYGAVLADGSEYRGDYPIGRTELFDFHAERLTVIAESAPDLLAIETIPNRVELEVLAELLAQFRLPAWVSASAGDSRCIADGTPAAAALACLAGPEVLAIGFNCTAPEHISGLLAEIADVRPELQRVVYPNSGRTWDPVGRRWLDQAADRLPADLLRSWVDLGATWLGGCCGLGSAQVEAVAAVLAERETDAQKSE